MEKLQCEICGGTLTMTGDGESAVCESCGMRFKKEAIKKMVMELSGPVQVEGIQNSNSLCDRAETFLSLGETQKASAAFQKMTDEYPSDYRGWWGLTRLTDWKGYFYTNGTGDAQPPLVCQRALKFSDGAAKAEIQRYFDEQVKTVKSKTDARLNAEKSSADRVEREYSENMRDFDQAYLKAMGKFRAAEQAEADARGHYAQLLANPPKAYTLKFIGSLIAIGVLSLFLSIGLANSSSEEMSYNLIFIIPIAVLVISIFIRVSRKAASVAAIKQHARSFSEAGSVLQAAQQAKDEAANTLNAVKQDRPQKPVAGQSRYEY